jgi:signal transduction histidine kinase
VIYLSAGNIGKSRGTGVAAQGEITREYGVAFSVLGGAVAIGLLISTEFFAQPFVWSGWAPGDVLAAWSQIALDRVLIAISIAICIVAARSLRARSRLMQFLLVAAAIITGAVLGEALRTFVDPLGDVPGLWEFVGRVLHWALVGIAIAGILACWRMNADYVGVAERTEAEAARTRRALLAFELDALQRQIEPHFLFNTLATIKRFGQTAPAAAYALLDRLFDYISAMLRTSRRLHSDLGSELDLVHAYLDVCAVRMNGKLMVVDEVPAELRAGSFPPLMLGTLVENAVRHGLAPSAGGIIALGARRSGNVLEVWVRDNGAGLVGEGGTGIGLANLSARLALLYGADASLQLEEVAPHGVCARVRLPYAPAV